MNFPAANQLPRKLGPHVPWRQAAAPSDSSDWATNCPKYKVAAVQMAKVMQPSEWQKEYADFNREQLALLAQARGEEATVGK